MHSLSAEAPPQYLTCYQEALLESPNDSVATLKFALFVYEIVCAWLCQEGCAFTGRHSLFSPLPYHKTCAPF